MEDLEPISPATPPPEGRRRSLSLLLGLTLSAVFLALLFSKIELRDVAEEIRQVHPGRLACILLTAVLGFFAMACRSAVLLRPLAPFSFTALFKSVLVSFAGNNVLPFRMGELLRVDYLARRGPCAHGACLAILAVERLLDVLCLVILFFGLATLVIELPSTPALVLLAAGVFLALVLLHFVGRYPARFERLLAAVTRPLGHRLSGWLLAQSSRFAEGLAVLGSGRRMAGAVFFSFLYWLAMAAGVWVVLWAFRLELPWYAPAVVLVFVTFGGMLPSSPAFIGTFHYFSSLALTFLGVEAARAASFAIVQHAAGMVPFTVISVVVLFGDFARGELSLRGR
jgi:hypothetical protein